MYVSPFWSHRPTPDGVALTERLDDRCVVFPAVVLELLEHIWRGDPVTDADDGLLAALQRLGIVHESHEAFDDMVKTRLAGDGVPAGAVPHVDQVELTNRCPYRCEMCPRTHFMTRAIGDMSLDLFAALISEIAPTQHYLALHHFGESLLHHDLAAAIELATRAGVRSGLSCNPPSLRPEIAAAILDAGIANLVLSLDSLDADRYRAIRGPAARADRADSNVRALVEARDRRQAATSITLQMIEMNANVGEAEQFLAYAEEVGVDRAVVIRLGRWDFDDGYIDRLGAVNGPGYTKPCSLPWSSVTVLWDGRVVPCCHDYNGSVVLGDRRTATLAEIWMSPAARSFRSRNRDNRLCGACSQSAWYRDSFRRRVGFDDFHRQRGGDGDVALEWVNPRSAGWRDGRNWFDRFDIGSASAT